MSAISRPVEVTGMIPHTSPASPGSQALLVSAITFMIVTAVTGWHFHWDTLLTLGAALGNAIWLFLGIFLLSYGLVEIPKHLWSLANMQFTHGVLCHRAGIHHANASQARRCARRPQACLPHAVDCFPQLWCWAGWPGWP